MKTLIAVAALLIFTGHLYAAPAPTQHPVMGYCSFNDAKGNVDTVSWEYYLDSTFNPVLRDGTPNICKEAFPLYPGLIYPGGKAPKSTYIHLILYINGVLQPNATWAQLQTALNK